MAGDKRQFELLLLRLVPHALRDDFMTVGLVVVEGEDSRRSSVVSRQENQQPGFVDARFTRDWKRVECFAPDLELEILEYLEKEVRAQLGEIRGRADLVRLLEERFGAVFDVGPVKALVAEDPVAEMRVLERDYLEPMAAGDRGRERSRQTGRMAIVGRMSDAFREAGILEILQRDLEMSEFTGKDDPFRVDFGFRVGTALKMFHGLALNISREPALMLAYRYERIREGMRARHEDASMTAIVSEEALRRKGEVASGIAMLRAHEVEVRGIREMGEIAERVRREVGG